MFDTDCLLLFLAGRLRGAECDTPAEMQRLTQYSAANQVAPPSGWKETLRALADASVRRPFFILIAYFGIYQFSGVNPLTFYAVDIFQETGTSLDKNVATILMGAVRLVFTVAGCALQRRLGRRPLTLLSCKCLYQDRPHGRILCSHDIPFLSPRPCPDSVFSLAQGHHLYSGASLSN